MSGVNCIDYGYMSVEATAKELGEASTGGIPARARGLMMTVESAGVRLRLDGTAATTGVAGGDLLNVGDVFILDSWTVPGQNWRSVMLGMRMIANVGGSTGNLSIHFFD